MYEFLIKKKLMKLWLLMSIITKINKIINFDFIKDLASECRMPFSYGGGISNIYDVEKLFNLGVKITVNTSVLNNYNFYK